MNAGFLITQLTVYFYTTHLTLKGRLFATFLPNLIDNEECNVSDKYWSCKSLRAY